jgi:2-polyprenyl-6-methoxyphenol hydroxylase-like FAD-dependent oxidoreductase
MGAIERVAVLGGGVAGLAATLALARDGRHVALIERDDVRPGAALDALDWRRKGIPHFLQPHAFTPRGRKELRDQFPDVYAALTEAGASDRDLSGRLRDGGPQAGDAELAYFAVRRPLIEWALWRAVEAEPKVEVRRGTTAVGLVVEAAATGQDGGPRVRGVRTSGGDLDADLVVDAMGRRTPTASWLEAAGAVPMVERSTECSIIYYSRYYRVRDGQRLPEPVTIPGPRGDLGYAAFSTFPGDNDTFCALIAIPPGDQALKGLRDVRAYEAATRTMPALDRWTNADTSEPITEVLPMGSLQNTIRAFPDERPPAHGLVSVGDTMCHTDPVLALGLSFALIHARHLTSALREHPDDPVAVATTFDALARPEMEERYAYVSAIDDARTRLWAGERLDYAHADGGAYPFFTFAASGLALLADADLARVLIRRNTFLDGLAVLDDDPAMQRRLEAFYGELAAKRTPAGPTRDELIGVLEGTAAAT